jgi:hypothetical protein
MQCRTCGHDHELGVRCGICEHVGHASMMPPDAPAPRASSASSFVRSRPSTIFPRGAPRLASPAAAEGSLAARASPFEPETEKKKPKTEAKVAEETAPDADQPGWCSDPSKRLRAEFIAEIDSGDLDDCIFDEEHLLTGDYIDEPLSKDGGNLELYQILEADIPDEEEDPKWEVTYSRIFMVEDAEVYGRPYTTEDAERLIEMSGFVMEIEPECNATALLCEAMDAREIITLLLLGPKQAVEPECLTMLANTSTSFRRHNPIVVQRRAE